MAQLEEAWAVNHVVGRLSPGCAKLTKSLQQAFNPKLLGLSDRDLNLGAPCATILLWARDPPPPLLRQPGAVSPDVLHNASLRITLTVSGSGTENWVTSNLPFLLDPCSIAKIQP